MSVLAGVVVVSFGLFFVGLPVVIFARPALAERFFLAFASTARAHYTEQALRLLLGASLVVLAPAMAQTEVFRLVGWAIVITAIGLILLPWRWHHRFGAWVLPIVVRHMRLYSVGLFGFGALLLYGAFSAL